MIRQVYATKQSMKQVFLDGRRVPVTLLKVESHRVIGQRTADRDGYVAHILGVGRTDKARQTNKAIQGTLKKNKIDFTPRYTKEVEDLNSEKYTVGDEIKLEDVLTPNSKIQVTGTSKGKGFTGTIKRWNFSAQNRTHGQSDRRRAPGSIGRGTTPGRVLPGKKMAGHHGSQTATITNLKIVSYEPKKHLLTVSGLIPGARNGLIKITILKHAPKVEAKEAKENKEVKQTKQTKQTKKGSKPEVSKNSDKK